MSHPPKMNGTQPETQQNILHETANPLSLDEVSLSGYLILLAGCICACLKNAPTPTIAPAVYRAIMALCRCTDAANDQMLDIFSASEKKGRRIKPPRSYAYLF